MIRRSIALLTVLNVLVFLFAGWQVLQGVQYSYPGHSNIGFTLNTTGQTASKQELANALNRLALEHGTNIYKVTSKTQEGTSNRDLLVFGDPHRLRGLPVQDGEISWATPGVTGSIITAETLGETPLAGDYVLDSNPGLLADLETQLAQQGVAMQRGEEVRPFNRSLAAVAQSGVGAVAFALLLVLTLLLIGYFALKMPGRTIKYLGGVPQQKIHREDLLTLVRPLLVGSLSGIALGAIALVLATNSVTLLALVPWVLSSVTTYAALFTLLALLISIICKPSLGAVRTRKENYRGVSLSLAAVGTVAILAITYTAPNVLALGKIAYTSFTQTQTLKSLGDAYTLNIDPFYFDQPQHATELESVLTEVDGQGDLLLSMALSTSLQGVKENSGGSYQDIYLVNPAYLRATGIDRESDLVALEPESPRAQSLVYWESQFELWLKDPENYSSAYTFYTPAEGVEVMGLGTNSNSGGEVFEKSDVLIMVLEDPTLYNTTSGLLMPLITTSNIFFSSPDSTRPLFEEAPFYAEAVRSVDRLIDNSLVESQGFWQETVTYFLAGTLLLLSILVLAFCRVLIWARSQRENIFILRSGGHSYRNITTGSFIRSLLQGTLALVVGSLLSTVTATYSTARDSAQTFALLFAAYLLILLFCYRTAVRREFRSAILREE